MAKQMRCPGCHMRLRPTLKLLVEQAKLECQQSGGTFTDAPIPEAAAQSFPCQRCGTLFDRGALVRGKYDERLPLPVVLEAPLVGVMVGYLFGWLYGWGPFAGTVTGLVAAAFSLSMLIPLHHNRVENHMLGQLGLPSSRVDWSEAIAFIAIALVMPGIATFLYRTMGWPGLISTTVVGIALLVYVSFMGDNDSSETVDEVIAPRDSQQVEDSVPRELR
jgi:hypothetical protein